MKAFTTKEVGGGGTQIQRWPSYKIPRHSNSLSCTWLHRLSGRRL